MTTTKKRTIQKPNPGRNRLDEEYNLAWKKSDLEDLEDLEYRNSELKDDNRLLRKLVAELSLGKLKAEKGF
jgi:hypothetical protein